MEDEMKQRWETAQLTAWQDGNEESKDFFLRFGVEIDCLVLGVFDLGYDDIQPVAYLIAKLRKMISICDFLDSRAVEHNEDVDKIKIFHLIQLAEVAISDLYGATGNNAVKIDRFFTPVVSRLQYSLRLAISDTNQLSKQDQDTSPSQILYKLRCEYAHQAQFTGKVFKRDSAEEYVYYGFSFDWDLPVTRSQINVHAETKLTYNEFLNIYFTAFKDHLVGYMTQRQT